MTVNVSVRWATGEDAPRIAAIHTASWRAAYQGLLADEVLAGLTLEGRERDWRGWLAVGGDREHTLLAELDGKPVAFCTLTMPTSDPGEPEYVAEIPALYVDPAAFGGGVGTALIEAAAKELRARGSREAVLWMLEGNERAALFYERRGWRLDGGRRRSDHYPGDDRPVEVRWRLQQPPGSRTPASTMRHT